MNALHIQGAMVRKPWPSSARNMAKAWLRRVCKRRYVHSNHLGSLVHTPKMVARSS